jgi:hypothetical protein
MNKVHIWDLSFWLLFHTSFLLGLFFNPEDGGDKLLLKLTTVYTELYTRRENSSNIFLFKAIYLNFVHR